MEVELEFELIDCILKEEIDFKRTKLNNLIEYGINDEIVKLSQELDVLITLYSKKHF